MLWQQVILSYKIFLLMTGLCKFSILTHKNVLYIKKYLV